MQQNQNGLTLKELAKFIGVTTQTVRNKLKNQGLLLSANHIGNKIVLTLDDCKKFIASSYPCLYNEFAKCLIRPYKHPIRRPLQCILYLKVKVE